MDKIKKLINSGNEEDTLIGIELLYNHYNGDFGRIRKFICTSESTIRLDVYIGDLNIVFYGAYSPAEVYLGEMLPLNNSRVVKL